MPESLEDLVRSLAQGETEQEKEPERNRYFPGGAIWNTLGFLDLVLGAPTRAVQGGIIAGMRGENVLEGAGKSLIGVSLDTGQFGIGEVASGGELLQELGIIEDKEQFGNIVAGIGVDVAMDLATWNLAGAARKMALKPGELAGKIAGVRHTTPEWNLVRRALGKKPKADYRELNLEETRLQKRIFFQDILRGKDGVRDLMRKTRGLKDLGVKAIASMPRKAYFERLQKLFETRRPLVYKLREMMPRQAGLQVREAKPLLTKLDAVTKELDDLLAHIDFGEIQVKLLSPEHMIQDAILKPLSASVANATKEARSMAQAVIGEHRAMKGFKVVNFDISLGHIGTARPATMMDMRFLNSPRMFRDVIPANLSRTGVEVAFRTRFKPTTWRRIAESIPPWLNPFDYMATLRRTGMMNRLAPAYMDFFEATAKDMEFAGAMAKKFGLKLDDTKTMEKIGNVGHGFAEESTLTPNELGFMNALKEHTQKLGMSHVVDPETKAIRKIGLLPEELHKAPYLSHMAVDRQQQIFRTQIGDHNGIPNYVNMAGDVPKGVTAPMLMRRKTELGNFETNFMKIYRAYSTVMNRKLHMEPALKAVLPTIQRLNQPGSAGLFHTAESVIHHFFGNYGMLDGFFDDLAAAVGLNTHHLATRMSTAITGAAYRAMLGLNPRTTLLQLHQGLLNNSLYLGLWDSLKGFVSYRFGTSKAPAQLAYVDAKIHATMGKHLSEGLEAMGGYGSRWERGMRKVDKILFGGLEAFDNINRGWAFHGGYNLAIREGLSEPQAILRGIVAANETQFIYGKLGASAARSTPLGRLMLQYQSFAAKQLQFLSQQFRRQPGVMMARYLAISGIVSRSLGQYVDLEREIAPTTPGDVVNIVTLDRIPGLILGQAVVDYAKAAFQEVSGVPRTERVVDPEFAAEQLARAFWTTVVPGGTMFNRLAKYQPTLEAAEDMPTLGPPSVIRALGRGLSAPIDALGLGNLGTPESSVLGLRTGGAGKELDRFGRKVKDLTPDEAALGVLGFQTKKSALTRQEVKDIQFTENWIKSRYEWLMTEAVRAVENDRDPEAFLERAAEIAQKQRALVLQALRVRLQNRQLSLKERSIKRLPKAMREEVSP